MPSAIPYRRVKRRKILWQWSDPEEDGDSVKVLGSGSSFGTIKIVLTYNSADKINKIEAGLA